MCLKMCLLVTLAVLVLEVEESQAAIRYRVYSRLTANNKKACDSDADCKDHSCCVKFEMGSRTQGKCKHRKAGFCGTTNATVSTVAPNVTTGPVAPNVTTPTVAPNVTAGPPPTVTSAPPSTVTSAPPSTVTSAPPSTVTSAPPSTVTSSPPSTVASEGTTNNYWH
ncbi:uncharacterized protein [Littorina saxatilis]|uniref:uncharacterized protein n=1 Tax=Littorina saxatilis TaxID=31220 RepID=UPI0038B4D20A